MAEVLKTTTDTPVSEAETTVENQNTVEAKAPKQEQVEVKTSTEPIEEPKKAEEKIEAKEKVFTQAQLDEILVTRLGKERARMLKKLGIEDEGALDSILEKSTKYESLKEELDKIRNEQVIQKNRNTLLELGADKDFIDYLRLNVVPEEGETFEVAAKKFLESNPKFKVETFKNVNSSVNVNAGSSYPDFTQMSPDQYLAWRAKNKL